MGDNSFIKELSRRNVLRVALAYAVVAWVVAQVSELALDSFGAPDWTIKTILFLLALGFPVALIFAWVFEMTPAGIKLDKNAGKSESTRRSTGRKLDITVAALLAIVLMYFGVGHLAGDPSSDTLSTASDGDAYEVVATERQSIAVLPFVNMSGNEENEYFSDGLTEEILNLLASIQEMRVIGRTSSFAFKGKNEDLRTIGSQLGVNTVLQGSVRRSGDRLRITAQLIDTSDGSTIWSDNYDRTMTDIFEVQESVAAAIIDALNVHAGSAPLRGRPTQNTDAYMQFLKARIAVNLFEFRRAEEILLKVVEVDPQFAEAHELLAYVYWYLGGTSVDSVSGQQAVGTAARVARMIDPDLLLAVALDKSANTRPYSFNVEIEALERVIDKQADNSWALGILIFRLIETGYLEEAVGVAQRFVQIDPLSAAAHNRLFEALYAAGRTSEALAALRVADSLGSDAASWSLGHVYLAQQRDDEAILHFEEYLTRNGYPDVSWLSGLVTGARNAEDGLAYLDRRIPEIVSTLPENYAFELQGTLSLWYLFFGHVDAQFDQIKAIGLSDEYWSDADVPIWQGTIFRNLGFTANPAYPEVAAAVGITRTWDERGAPDFCEKKSDQWICK